MSRPQVELDFFSVEKDRPRQQRQHHDRRPTIRGIQNVVSKIKPEVLRSFIASGSANGSTPKSFDNGSFVTSPVYCLPVLGSTCEKTSAPMTIFYNGAVCVFDLPPDKAESIMKLATELGRLKVKDGEADIQDNENNSAAVTAGQEEKDLLGALNEADLPIMRKKSLQRFFEKRKERLTSVSPY
ncbi:hypothetical protein Ancab_018195 [Ancistrocladus abbreviatus]